MPRKTPDGIFHATVKVEPNPSKQTEIEIPVIIARDLAQAKVVAEWSIRTLGMVPSKRKDGFKCVQLNPRETVRTRRVAHHSGDGR